jgi:GT2 family glycosyltransferase
MIYVVIPVHDRLALTRNCLDDLSQQDAADMTVVVVDDGSTDGTAETLARDYPSVLVLRGDGDLWWTGATNLGVAWALDRAADTDYILTLNNDTRCGRSYVRQLAVTAARHSPAIVGSLAVDGHGRVVQGGIRVNWLTAKRRVLAERVSLGDLRVQAGEVVSVDVLPGRGTLIPVSALRSLGLFEPTLPHYGADYEFSRRAADHGYALLVSYDAVLEVQPDETGLHADHGWRPFLLSFVSRRSANNLLYRWRYARLACPRSCLVPYAVMDTVRVIGGSFRRQVLGR